jgi:hypothetical protein
MSKRHEIDIADIEMRGRRRIIDERVRNPFVPAATASLRDCREQTMRQEHQNFQMHRRWCKVTHC